eukprot:128925-Amphidinium_carterae.1
MSSRHCSRCRSSSTAFASASIRSISFSSAAISHSSSIIKSSLTAIGPVLLYQSWSQVEFVGNVTCVGAPEPLLEGQLLANTLQLQSSSFSNFIPTSSYRLQSFELDLYKYFVGGYLRSLLECQELVSPPARCRASSPCGEGTQYHIWWMSLQNSFGIRPRQLSLQGLGKVVRTLAFQFLKVLAFVEAIA